MATEVRRPVEFAESEWNAQPGPHTMTIALPCYCNALRQAARVVTSLYDERMRGLGLRVTQYTVLQSVGHHPDIATGALAASLDMDQTTMSRTLATLSRKGWIVARDGADRREKHWRLTKDGIDLARRAARTWKATQSEMDVLLGSERANLLREITSGVVEALAQPVSRTVL